MTRKYHRAAVAAALVTISHGVFAEGSYQTGLNQPLQDFDSSGYPQKVDIVSAGEVINVSLCGSHDYSFVKVQILDPSGAAVYSSGSRLPNVSCSDPMSAPLTTPIRYVTASAGTYTVQMQNIGGDLLKRFDITVTPDIGTNPDPSASAGRLWAYGWSYNTGSFSEENATDADYFALLPGGRADTNYVWKLDLNKFSGYVYTLLANDLGVDAPNSGYSVPNSGNHVSEKYPLYFSYPAIAKPRPTEPPVITGGLTFTDSAGQDSAISPAATPAVQDSGIFAFTSDVDGTYAITIDTNSDGVFGAGDKLLLGNMQAGLNQVVWDGTDASGAVLADGRYAANLEARLGEYHFIADDVETSGGDEDGMTIYLANSDGSVSDTTVYWDDATFLGGTSVLPHGALSSTPEGKHTWGDFNHEGSGVGNNAYVDTYVHGLASSYTAVTAIVSDDTVAAGVDGTVEAPPRGIPGDSLAITVADNDLNILSGSAQTATVEVINPTTGEQEQVILTETAPDSGIFTATLATTDTAGAGTNNDGGMNVQDGDVLNFTYRDQLDASGGASERTANTAIHADHDGDGIPDIYDLDDDNDGIPDSAEGNGTVDSDGDGIPDSLDLDSNGDGIFDIIQAGGIDANGDGMVDGFVDANGDGLDDTLAASPLPLVDSDGDGIPDHLDTGDQDGDGIADTVDLDDDNDGIPDSAEGDGTVDSDSDGVPDSLDLDSDNDGIPDLYESGIANPAALDSNGDGRIDSGVGANGLADALESAPDSGLLNYPVADSDGDGVPDFRDLDSDNDGISDVIEAGGSDPDNDGMIGSGTPVVDGNGLAQGSGLIPPDSDGDGIANPQDLDSDGDGISDVIEAGGSDPDGDGMVGSGTPAVDPVTGLPVSGGGLVPSDSNGDGIPDCVDNTDSDGDGVPDSVDLDDDNDGIPDSAEGDGMIDSDGDGVPDSLDLDSDNDGLTDLSESGIYAPQSLDRNNDGRIDSGFGGNGLADIVESGVESGSISYRVADSDGDAVPDFRDLDSDNDGIYDVIEANGEDGDGNGIIGSGQPSVNAAGIPGGGPLAVVDSDGDTIPDFRDRDSDNDGLYDVIEAGGSDPDSDGIIGSGSPSVDERGLAPGSGLTPPDSDGDGVFDYRDLDSDNDGIADVTENGGSDPDGDGIIGQGVPAVSDAGVYQGGMLVPVDSDGDGTPNQLDLDSNGDGINDIVQAGGNDADGDGRVDGFVDGNGDGLDDGVAASPLPTNDSDGDGIPDYKDTDDRDHDGIPDTVDLDKDNDGIPDSEEGDGAVDTDGDGIPDSLDLDSDNDGIFDLYESGIGNAAELDGDSDGRIDTDVGRNGLADAVETSPDSGVLDYPVADSDGDGIPDYRDLDSDNDTISDVIESGGSDPDGDGRIGSGEPEVNDNGVPGGGSGVPRDSDGDGIPDQRDRDSNGDGVDDVIENGGTDENGDGMQDGIVDENGDGYTDNPPVNGGGDSGANPGGDNGGNTGVGDGSGDASQSFGTSRSGGGCTVAPAAPFDPLLPLLVLLSLLMLNRGRLRTLVRGELS